MTHFPPIFDALRACTRPLLAGVLALGLLGCSRDEPSAGEKKQQITQLPETPPGEFPAITFVAQESARVTFNSQIIGSVAVLNPSSGGEPTLTLGLGAELRGDVWADAVDIRWNGSISGDVSTNTLSGPGSVGGQIVPAVFPLILELPPVHQVVPGTSDVEVVQGQTLSLPAGSYRTISLGVRRPRVSGVSVLRLTGGVYQIQELNFQRDSEVYCDAPCDVRVVNRLELGRNMKLVPHRAAGVTARDVRVFVGAENSTGGLSPWLGTPAVRLAAQSAFEGSLHAPHGTVRILRQSEFLGKVVAKYLDLGLQVSLDHCATSDATCDGIDDDCDGQIDEDYVPLPLTCGVGACAAVGVAACVSGIVQEVCEPGAPAADDSTCDGIDDDCDGEIDEDYVESPVTCGVGACQAEGSRQCVSGGEVVACVPGQPAESDTTCDGIDDNCNGQVDEGFQPVATSCGLGVCAAAGQISCQSGAIIDTCTPGSPAPDDSSCDGFDNDCDGVVDEDYASVTTSCGVGACGRTGMSQCLGGSVVDSCQPGSPAPVDATCDGIDDDCDGLVDEDYVADATSCGLGVCASTGARQCISGAIVDSCQPLEGAASDATCDGVDDDCDGQIDEDYTPIVTSCGDGVCTASGVTSCVDGQESDSCTVGSTGAEDATCDGIDNDCDGEVDEDFEPSATTCGLGACQTSGMTSCQSGILSDSCVPLPPGLDDSTCDGIDNDCDGEVDEDYAPLVTTCGVGACGATGQTSCQSGVVIDSCQAGSPAGNDTTCDGIDDDCDGLVDEDYQPIPTTCGQGACAATGMTACVAGRIIDSCAPSAPALLDATCDGIDDDCDGQVDEDYVSVPTSCGQGACAAAGSTSCENGQVENSCNPGQPAPADATCDGIDDDCDGVVDEDFIAEVTTCGVGACADTGLTACISGQVENTCRAGTPVVGDFECNGIDDDCDGSVDEDYISEPTQCGVGACGAQGSTTCVGGAVQNSCVPGAPALSDATCNGIDDDCDGLIDEDYQGLVTSCGVGACQTTGAMMCVDGVEEDSCRPLEGDTSDTTCDGVDDDCDGSVDEDYVALVTSCGTGGCQAAGATSCILGVEEDSCEPGTAAASDETCDGIDNDCDGLVDEDYQPRATSCGIGACSSEGLTSCTNGFEADSCTPGERALADFTCNGIDDDCDGQVDEDYEPAETSCGVGACAASGLVLCVSGAEVNSCQPGTPAPADDTCNGIDDNCDGSVDEGYQPELLSCGVGACLATGQSACEGGVVRLECEPGTPAADDAVCNGVDDDCDGSVDEDFVPGQSSCGVGACAAQGTTQCVAGAIQDLCTPGVPASSDSTCDGIDNNCDGQVDEGYQPVPTECGVGSCSATGMTQCVDGTVQNVCTPGQPAPSDATCDGIDDDCDGEVDEDYVSAATSCGVGQCASVGATSCAAGQVVDSCRQGTPASSDASCDGLDDDCDGEIDEDFVATSTTCGVGACGATGERVCAAGQIQDTCTPGAPAASDATCDGVDNDCDGSIDEDYAPEAITCGQGACQATGHRICSAGELVDQCVALPAPSTTDTTCDGVDDDCNGSIDDGYVPRTVTCGLGECVRTAQTTCVAGVEDSHCEPGFPAFSNDLTCDGRDEDCDGQVDEDFVGQAISCGVGACQASGVTICQGGVIQNACTPGQPAPNDTTCNGIDDDCDGSVDEDFVASCVGNAVQSCESGVLQSQNCSNGNVCDGVETCSAASCQPGTPPNVDDGNPCSIGSCDPVLGVIQSPAPIGSSCGNGLVCDGNANCVDLPRIIRGPQDIEVAVGQPFSLFVEATGGALTYQWYRDGALIPGATSTTLTVLAAAPADDGATFKVAVTNLTGSIESNEAIVSVGDAVGPVLSLITAPTVVTFDDPFTVLGTAVDAATGVESVWVENAHFLDLKVAAVVDAATGSFSAEVPLSPGVNALTVFARDGAGNVTFSQLLVTLQVSSVPVIQIYAPLSGMVSQTDRVTVLGMVRTSLLGNQLRIELGGRAIFPTGSSGEYPFSFDDVLLAPGLNSLTVRAVTPEGFVSQTVEVFYGDSTAPSTGTPPRISLFGVRPLMHATQAESELRGTVEADTCVQQLTVNGAAVQATGTGGAVSFATTVTAPSDGSRFPVVVTAVDCFGRTAAVGYEIIYDGEAPVVSLSVAEAPQVTYVDNTPYRVYGSIAEPNLAGIAIGSQSIGAAPTGGDTWEFEFDVPLAAGVDRELTLTIWDQAGNRTVRKVILHLDATLEIVWLSPENGSKISTLDDPVSVAAAIRVPGIAPGDTATARLDGGAAVPLLGQNEVRSGTFSVPLMSRTHEITAQVVGSDGTPKAQATTRFSIEDVKDLPVEVAAIFPVRGAQDVEPNAPVSITLSRPIESSELEVRVTESGRAMVYKQQQAGADLVTMRHPELVEVIRNNETTPGGISAIPGDRTFIFYPQRDYVYSGEVRVAVTYEGEDIINSNFRVRRPPTLMDGLVFDQGMNALVGLSVALRDGAHRTTTDSSGAFAFGFGTIDKAIAGGKQLLAVNPGQQNPRYGSLEIFVNLQEGRYTASGAVRVPRLDLSEPYRLVTRSPEVSFLDGDLVMNFGATDFVFPGGSPSGLVHAQPVNSSEFSFPTQGSLYPVFSFVMNPIGVEVSGPSSLSCVFPRFGGGADYVDNLPQYLVIAGVDPTTRMLVPVGVGEVNREARTLTSRGDVWLDRLDLVTIAFLADANPAILAAYANGEASLAQLRSAAQ